MKQKKQSKVLKFSKFIFLVGFLFVEFFGLDLLKVGATTFCSYSYNYNVAFDANPKTVSANGNVTFTTIVTVSDTSGLGQTTCPVGGYVIVDYFYSSLYTNGWQQASSDVQVGLTSGQGQDNNTFFSLASVPSNLQSTASVQPQTSYQFRASVYADTPNGNGGYNKSLLPQTTSGIVSVTESAAGGGTSGLQNNGVACNDSSTCKSNFCSAATDNCQPCAGDSDCNSNGDSGFSCAQGVCVKVAAQGTPPTSAAQGTPPTGAAQGTPPVTSSPNPSSYNCSTPNAQNCLYNPLPEDSLTATLLLITKGFLGIVGAWAAVFILIGGFQLVMSSGNEESVLKAKKTIMWAILGLIVALLSFSIIAIVQNLFEANIQPVTTTTTNTSTTNPPTQ